MQRRLTKCWVISALLANNAAFAAQDMGLSHSATRNQQSRPGEMAAQASVTIKFGSQTAVRARDRVRLGLSAGPVLKTSSRTSSGAERRAVATVLGLSIAPRYHTSVTLAGQSIFTHQTVLGAQESQRKAEEESGETGKKPKKGPSTLGWVGIGVGALVVVGGAALALAIADYTDCSDGNCD